MTNVAIIVVLVVIITSVVLYFILTKKNRDKKIEKFELDISNLLELHAKLLNEFERTEKISKNPESILLFESWLAEYEKFKEDYATIERSQTELLDSNSFKERGEFKVIASEIEGLVYSVDSQSNTLYEKVKKYTEFELENTRISLTLKGRIEQLNQTFNSNLKFLDIYNDSYYKEIDEAEDLIKKFEELQRLGDYPEGRNILKNANRILDKLDYISKLVLTFQDYLHSLQDDIDIINRVKNEIENIGYALNIDDFEEKITGFSSERDSIVGEVILITFEESPAKETLVVIQNNLENLDERIREFKNLVEDKFEHIKDIMEYEKLNTELLSKADNLIEAALEEKKEIEKLYEINDYKQMKKFDDEIVRYTKFKEDYSSLIEIAHEAREDFEASKSRIVQANQYLIRLLKNVEDAVIELKAIRSDELNARANFNSYLIKNIEIDLYLRKYDHKEYTSKVITSLLQDLNNSINSLEHELDQETLNIVNVRMLENSVKQLIQTLTDKEIENNIKQRIGSELFIQYLSQFNTNEESNIILKRLNAKYIDCEYSQLLHEAYDLLKNVTPEYKKIYAKITERVDIEPFEDVLTNKNEVK